MLQVAYLRENQNQVVRLLLKRNFTQAEEAVNEVIVLDQERRNTVQNLESIQSESNTLSKQIGLLMREGNQKGAEEVKARTFELKTTAKELTDKLSGIEQQLLDVLYKIPNVPN